MIVGLTGYATSGKDTAAQGLIDIGYERIAWADKLREGLYALNPIVSAVVEVELLEHARENMGAVLAPGVGVQYLRLAAAVDAVGWDEAKKLPEIRSLLQRYGTEAGRDIHGKDTWVEALWATLVPGVSYVIPDCRFPNEVERIHRAGGLVVRIERAGVEAVNAHVSDDIADLPVDYVFRNIEGSPGVVQTALVELVV